ncbi:conserved hypothetical protein [Talaromyces stipitatus ATCC 10500]|uniref:Uncharacterized protein n=1 Tax=Talaromyces stipitatus (strain ATCC 10500 / CBS 375.48 / QM 6759 / NRRL 1006) TaxID=441959 RepID=B8MIW6_TALSN|nr:uncharacterized protein TSTA_050660 [Talaromyces stipitatus ATCC 10500]EED15628.1 conserved hypothetical protein [Talaromyces stipitatus ATCC 10500]
MSSSKPLLFGFPAHTLGLFDDYIDEEDETLHIDPVLIDLTEDTYNNGESAVKSVDNDAGDRKYDDDKVGVFAPQNTGSVSPRVLTLTQQNRRLPKHLRTGHHRTQEDIIMERESYTDLDTTPTSPGWRSSSYASVHSTPSSISSTTAIPTGGGGFIYTNSFMKSTQRKGMEHLGKLEEGKADLEVYITKCPTDVKLLVKLRAKLLHLDHFSVDYKEMKKRKNNSESVSRLA